MLASSSGHLHACAACFGQSDAPMAQGMNMGIFTLLLVVLSVLLGIAAFFFYLLRRAARLAASTELQPDASPSTLTAPGVDRAMPQPSQ